MRSRDIPTAGSSLGQKLKRAQTKMRGRKNGAAMGSGTHSSPKAFDPGKDIRPGSDHFSAGIIIIIVTMIRVMGMTTIPVNQTICRYVSLSTCQTVDLSVL